LLPICCLGLSVARRNSHKLLRLHTKFTVGEARFSPSRGEGGCSGASHSNPSPPVGEGGATPDVSGVAPGEGEPIAPSSRTT
jgi:hypothetical protein